MEGKEAKKLNLCLRKIKRTAHASAQCLSDAVYVQCTLVLYCMCLRQKCDSTCGIHSLEPHCGRDESRLVGTIACRGKFRNIVLYKLYGRC